MLTVELPWSISVVDSSIASDSEHCTLELLYCDLLCCTVLFRQLELCTMIIELRKMTGGGRRRGTSR